MKICQTSLLLAAVLLIVSLSGRAEQSYVATIGNKAGTGLLNAAAGWMEIPKTMIVTSRNEGLGIGLTGGFFMGLANTLGRSVMGVVDLATFPIPTKPMVTPPLIWEKFGQETSFSNSWEMYETK